MKTQFFQGPMLVFTGPLGLQMIAIKRCCFRDFQNREECTAEYTMVHGPHQFGRELGKHK